jgi:Skp family chaperone for outer membrane proteins
MKNIVASAALAASMLVPAAAQAQAIPAAVIAVVDVDRVYNECTACKTAAAALRTQLTNYQNRQKALAGPIQTEGQSLQTAVAALNGKDPDAALAARIKAFQTREQSAANELQTQQQQIERNQAYIRQQIATKLGPIFQQVMTRRGANVMLESGSTLATATSVDVTNDVLAGLNGSLTTISTTAPAQAQTQPQGR